MQCEAPSCPERAFMVIVPVVYLPGITLIEILKTVPYRTQPHGHVHVRIRFQILNPVSYTHLISGLTDKMDAAGVLGSLYVLRAGMDDMQMCIRDSSGRSCAKTVFATKDRTQIKNKTRFIFNYL